MPEVCHSFRFIFIPSLILLPLPGFSAELWDGQTSEDLICLSNFCHLLCYSLCICLASPNSNLHPQRPVSFIPWINYFARKVLAVEQSICHFNKVQLAYIYSGYFHFLLSFFWFLPYNLIGQLFQRTKGCVLERSCSSVPSYALSF